MADFYKNYDQIKTQEDCPATGIQYTIDTDTPLGSEPVDIDFFKKHARIDFDTDDELVQAYITAARIALEQYAQKSFGPKTMIITAEYLPPKWRLMYGPVDAIATADFTNVKDILQEGGADIEVEYTSLGLVNDDIRIAICRYAAGLYTFRENVVDSKIVPQMEFDAAKAMIKPYMNVTLF